MSLDCPLKRFAGSQDATGLDRLADPFTNFGDFRETGVMLAKAIERS
jgi:hypothetical protein